MLYTARIVFSAFQGKASLSLGTTRTSVLVLGRDVLEQLYTVGGGGVPPLTPPPPLPFDSSPSNV